MRLFLPALWTSKFLDFLIKKVAPSRGSNYSGDKGLFLDPLMVSHFKGIDPDKVIFITGTNGKSSTTNLLNHILREQGLKIVSNTEGANLLPGIATSLSKASDIKGNLSADFYIFETDERYLPIIYKQLPAKHLLITNLQKDQVQRNGDPDFILRKFRGFINKDMTLYLNDDDPRSRSLEDLAGKTYYFGVGKNSDSFTKGPDYPTLACEKCGDGIVFDYFNTDNVGRFTCPSCGYSSHEKRDMNIEGVDFEGRKFSAADSEFHMSHPLPYMLYNYSAGLLAAEKFAGINPSDTVSSFDTFKNIAGRYEEIPFGNKTIKYLRIKQENPDTLQNAINIVASDKNPKAVCIGLYKVSDFEPHYTNTFYTYDCDFKPLVDSETREYLCFSETVAYDTAVRLKFEGVSEEIIKIQPDEDIKTLLDNISRMESDNVYLITWLSSYDELKKHTGGN